MTDVQRKQVPAVISLAGLGTLGGNLSSGNGECSRVCQVPEFPGWVYKEYRAPLSLADVRRLDRLIGLPAGMVQADSALAASHASWPASRVVSGQRSVGVLIPLAPGSYQADLETRPGKKVRKMLEVDMLALPESRQEKLGLPPQSLANRLAVCASIARVGALFERHGLAYLDWSYANVFWRSNDHCAYVIDMDGCSFGPRAQIESPNWDDPLVPRGSLAGNETDRYRLALLIGRCLTSERADAVTVRTALNGMRLHSEQVERVVELLISALSAATVAERPSLESVCAALGMATRGSGGTRGTGGTGGVTGWHPVRRPAPTATGARPRPVPGSTRTKAPAPKAPAPKASAPTAPIPKAPAASPAASSNGASTSRPLAAGGTGRQPVKSTSGSSAEAWGCVGFVVFVALIIIVVVLVAH